MKFNFLKTLPLALVFLGSATFISCKDNKSADTEITAEDTMDMDLTSPEEDAHLVAWSGTYEGTFPCADCEGIETTIVLNNDGSYEKHSKYLKGTEPSEFDEMGSYSIDDNNVITLKPANEDNVGGTLLYKFENDRIVALTQEGNKVTGDLADHYVLKKQ